MSKPVKCKKCGSLNNREETTGNCLNCGAFIRGNKHGESSKRRDAVKYAIRDAVSPEEAKALLRDLMNDDNPNVKLKALELFLNRMLGRSVTPVITNPEKSNHDMLSDEMRDMLEGLVDPDNGVEE